MAKKKESALWGLREAARELQMSIEFVKKLVEVGELPTLDAPVMGTLRRDGWVPAPADAPPDRWGVRPKRMPAVVVVEDPKYFEADTVRRFGPTFRAKWNRPCECATDDLGRPTNRPRRDCPTCGGTGEGAYRRELAPRIAALRPKPERPL